MEIKYVNNREDYIKGYEKSRRFNLRIEILRITFIMTILTGVFFYFVNELSDFYNVEKSEYIYITLISTTIVIVGSILMNIISKRNMHKLVDKMLELRNDVIGTKLIEIEGDIIIYKGVKSYFQYNIKTIDNIDEKDGLLILYTQKISPLLILPLNSFENEEQKGKFISLIKQKSQYLR